MQHFLCVQSDPRAVCSDHYAVIMISRSNLKKVSMVFSVSVWWHVDREEVHFIFTTLFFLLIQCVHINREIFVLLLEFRILFDCKKNLSPSTLKFSNPFLMIRLICILGGGIYHIRQTVQKQNSSSVFFIFTVAFLFCIYAGSSMNEEPPITS